MCLVFIPIKPHTSHSAPVTKVSASGYTEQSEIFARSLTARGKHSPPATWLKKLKRDSLMQHLSTRMLSPSRTESFTRSWVEALSAQGFHASRCPVPGNDKPLLTSDGCSISSVADLNLCSLGPSSLRMSMACSPPRCLTDHSSLPTSTSDWKKWVTGLRLEYSQRMKSARPTSANGSSSSRSEQASDTTPAARDFTNTSANPEHNEKRWAHSRGKTLPEFVKYGPPGPESGSIAGSLREPVNALATASAWQTPKVNSGSDCPAERLRNSPNLGAQANMNVYPTPMVGMGENSHGQISGQFRREMDKKRGTSNAKLNPRWVETLMGLPIGWTQPSCTAPLTIESTNCACSATGSCQLQQKRLSESCGGESCGVAQATPTALNHDESYYQRSGANVYPGLAKQAKEAALGVWQTPRAQDSESGRKISGAPNLHGQVRQDWPTIRASDAEHGGPNQRGSKGDLMLPSAEQQTEEPRMWGTPVANDDNKSPEAHLAMKARMGGNRTAITSLTVQVKAEEAWGLPL